MTCPRSPMTEQGFKPETLKLPPSPQQNYRVVAMLPAEEPGDLCPRLNSAGDRLWDSSNHIFSLGPSFLSGNVLKSLFTHSPGPTLFSVDPSPAVQVARAGRGAVSSVDFVYPQNQHLNTRRHTSQKREK